MYCNVSPAHGNDPLKKVISSPAPSFSPPPAVLAPQPGRLFPCHHREGGNHEPLRHYPSNRCRDRRKRRRRIRSAASHLLHPGVRDPKNEQSVLWLRTRLEQYPPLLLLPAEDVDTMDKIGRAWWRERGCQ